MARATEVAIDVLPTPGGPLRLMMAPFISLPASLRTATYSTMRSFTSSNP